MDLVQLESTPSFESHARLLIEASEANIARIESQIRDLERLRDRERAIVARLRAAIAPVHKLPAELLVEIFRYHCSYPSIVKKVQALSHVCVYWRRVAITTPQLWTNVPYIDLAKTPTDPYVAGLKEWVDRSAPLPIHVHLRCRPGADATAVVGILLTAVHRWNGANFILPSLSVLSRVPPEALKCLQKLNLHSRDTTHATLATFSLAHNLHTLSLDARRTARLRLPWSNLEELDMTADTPQECLDSLLQCTNIVSAQFRMPPWADLPDLSGIKLTTLERLERLTIIIACDPNTLTSDGFIVPFFVCLTLPALKRLSLDLAFDVALTVVEFTQFQLRSPNIDYLSINSSHINSDDLIAVLRHAPSLLELNLQYCSYAFGDIVLEALCSSLRDPLPLVPRLHKLVVYEGCEDINEDMLDASITSRWWTDEQLATFPSPPQVSRWSHFEIESDGDDVSEEFETKLKEYRAQGLPVHVV
ncbi:hypothetical protein B0H16DRAFT_1894746 [Mycena metata]|uniref:F-box domain-containing protein n=1 Tax=Mycena metata TaxID=1033252 RepID=A0AAD7HRA7_9AGAR|nr:hypothetical protein B0H16DRAFT_1894746 [Mycena metata]